jgi:uncharacterized protein YyaL (SSP411 family)
MLTLLVLALVEPWSPWGHEAVTRARHEGRPVLVVLGDAQCAPCRRAEADVLADAATATLLADSVVGVRADRLERPDLDDLFRTTASLLGVEREYPLAVLLTADGRPFAARAGASGDLPSFVRQGALDYVKDRARIDSLAAKTLESLRRAQRSEKPTGPLDAATLSRALAGATETLGADIAAGSHPHAALRFLLEEQERRADANLLRMAGATLDYFATAGEPTDLRDLALFLKSYAEAYTATGKALYRERAAGLARSALQMADPGGGFRAREGDERVVSGWNGLAIGALAVSGRQLARKQDLEAAKQAAARLLARLGPADRLRRFARGSEPGGPAFLEDHAFLAEAFLEIHEADGEDSRWLGEAVRMVDAAVARFWDPADGGFFTSDAGHDPLPVRIRSGYDDAGLSGNGVMASVLLRLARATGETRYRDLARQTVEAFLGDLQRAPRGMESLASAAGELLGRPRAVESSVSATRARAVHGAVSLELAASRARGAPTGTFDLRVRLAVAPGWQVVAHEQKAKDVVGLSVSVPGRDLTVSSLCYPAPTAVRDPRGIAPLDVLEGGSDVTMTVRRASRDATLLAVRVVFQACDRSGCRPPEVALLEVPPPE